MGLGFTRRVDVQDRGVINSRQANAEILSPVRSILGIYRPLSSSMTATALGGHFFGFAFW